MVICIEVALTRTSGSWKYEAHYRVGWPDDRVADDIPDSIKRDFQEALRCRWVGKPPTRQSKWCGRALEASCLEQGAPAKLVLNDMIDWVTVRKDYNSVRGHGHKIKLGGNRGAHRRSGREQRARWMKRDRTYEGAFRSCLRRTCGDGGVT